MPSELITPIKQKIAIIGDHVTDLLLPAESKQQITEGKETLSSGLFLSESTATGNGGVIYLQQIFDNLLNSHSPKRLLSIGSEKALQKKRTYFSNELRKLIYNQPISEHIDLKNRDVNHWSVAKMLQHLSGSNEEVYRVVEHMGQLQMFSPEDERFSLPIETSFSEAPPELLIISDHKRTIRYRKEWETTHREWLAKPSIRKGTPRRVILLANRLPLQCLSKHREEPLWNVIFDSDTALESTLVVTSIDRLRQEGANVSKRLSWDSTLTDFMRELSEFSPLKILSNVAHLIVRIGVVGAIHCYWRRNSAGERLRREVRFLYDPDAAQGVFRERVLQGNAFGIRSAMPACIAYQLLLQLNLLADSDVATSETQLAWYDQGSTGAVRRGIKDAICLMQEIYTAGFGKDMQDVKRYMENLAYRKSFLQQSFDKVYQSQFENVDLSARSIKIPELKNVGRKTFIHIVRPPLIEPKAPPEKQAVRWNILKDNLSAMIKRDELINEVLRDTDESLHAKTEIDSKRKLVCLEEFRRLRMARAICFLGVDKALNEKGADKEMVRRKNEPLREYLDRMLQTEKELDFRYIQRMQGEVFQQEIKNLLVPERKNSAFPLNAPVAKFGSLKVLGQTDIENFSSIRNLIVSHLKSQQSKPLSIAVFGSPGSGKSFGITEIAKAIAKDKIDFYTCNLSQLSTRDDLNREFFNVSQILLKGKIPLIFFDEFDSPAVMGGNKHGWLKYFLEPMQDGFFRHTDGVVQLKNSIFVFAGGMADSLKNFYTQHLTGQALEEAKRVKLPDFVSRISGFINIPGLNAGKDKAHQGLPYVRRALVLRSLVERDERLLDKNKIAQIDRNVVDAFLKVSTYFHGARSMTAIFNMCARWGRRLDKFTVPSSEQLDIHTIGEEFRRQIITPDTISTNDEEVKYTYFSDTLSGLEFYE